MKCPRCQTDNPSSSRFCADCGTSLSPPPDTPSPPRTQTLAPSSGPFSTGILFAGRYQIIEELGRGGMGKVYKAFDTKIQERIAIKIIRPDIADDAMTIERFRNELKLTRQITHRNVCRMHDLGQDGLTPFITMEFVPGENLQNIMRMTRPLSIGTAVDYAQQICAGLAEAHRLGVIHRDLKPQNIIIDEAGTAKIMDFGIARTVHAAGLTGEGMMIGTPDYMAPEQAEGKAADQRSDIYALGVILFEMVTGKRPFAGDTPVSIAVKQKTEIPRPPIEWNAQVPEVLNALILKCLEKDKAKRYQTAADLMADLAGIESLLPRSGEFARGRASIFPALFRRRMIFALGAGAALVLFAALGYFFVLKAPSAISLAVLPFKDLSPRQDQVLICEGLADDIRSRLTGIPRLNVSLKDSSDQWMKSSKTIREFGRALNVQKTVSGTLQIEKDVVVIKVELGDVRRGFSSWSEQFRENLDELNRLEARIANAIADELKLPWGSRSLQNAKARETENLNAYTEFREGMRSLTNYRNLSNKEDFLEAIKRFQKAIEHDSKYCLAYWGLGDTYEARVGKAPDAQAQIAMEQYYTQAYEINGDLPEAVVGMGWIWFHREDFDKAFAFFQKAVEMEPDNPRVVYSAGSFLRSIGLYRSALKHYLRAIDLDPLSYRAYLTCISCYSYIGEFKKALALAKRAVEIEPSIPRTHAFYARQLIVVKRTDEAEQELARAEEISPLESSLPKLKAWIAAIRGQKERALDLIDTIRKSSSSLYSYEVTNAYCLLGMTDEAIKNIRTGIDVAFRMVRDNLYSYPYLATNPFFDGLRKDPRFREILTAEKIKYQDKMKKFGAL